MSPPRLADGYLSRHRDRSRTDATISARVEDRYGSVLSKNSAPRFSNLPPRSVPRAAALGLGPGRQFGDLAAQCGEGRRDDMAGVEAGGVVLGTLAVVVQERVGQHHRADLEAVNELAIGRQVVQDVGPEAADRALLDGNDDLVL